MVRLTKSSRLVIENDSNADFTAATTASKSAVFAIGMSQVFSSFTGLSDGYMSIDPSLTQEPLM
jgi:hypothetical protein